MMATSYTNNKDALLKRLTRAEGQVRGVSRMVAEDTYCIDVITQISAVQAALDKVAMELLRDHARHCLTEDAGDHSGHADKTKNSPDKADELVGAIARLLAR